MSDVKFIGLDVHKTSISAAVLDGGGKLVMQAVFVTEAAAILGFIGGLKGTLHVTFEESTPAAWLHALLKPAVAEVLVCNPRRNALLKSGNKSDRIDARKLAELLRAGLLSPVYHDETPTQTLKELGRSYRSVTDDTTRVMRRLKALSQPGHRQRGQEAIHAAAPGAVVKPAPAGRPALSRRTHVRAVRHVAGSAPTDTLRSHPGGPQAHSYGGAQQRSLCGTNPFRVADCSSTNSLSLPQQTSVLGLLRTGIGDAQQCRPPGDRGRAATQEQTRFHPRIEPKPQS
jgi:hypothetical protein